MVIRPKSFGAGGLRLPALSAPPARTVLRQTIHTSGSWSLVQPQDPFKKTAITVQAGTGPKVVPLASLAAPSGAGPALNEAC